MGRKSRLTDGSCLYCRKRRLRCDLGHPQCSRCRENDQECNYGTKVQLKWVGGMAARGRLATPASKIILRPHDSDQKLGLAITPQLRSPIPDNPDLITYFGSAVLPRFQIDDRLVKLDFDAVIQDQTLQQAILAVAEAHYALNSKSISTEVVLLRKKARFRAIESFRHLLDTEVFQESNAQQLFTINVLLCMLDGVIEPSDECNASICHLRGGFAILSKWRNTCAKMLVHGGMQAHLVSVFATMDLVHALLKGEKPFFESVTWLMFANTPTWFGSLTSGDPFLAILKAYSEVACLGHIIHNSANTKDSQKLVERCLPSIAPFFKVSHQDVSDLLDAATSERYWTIFCLVYRICGLVYVERALRSKHIDDATVQSHARQGVEILAGNILPGMMSHCLVFPVLVIGSHCIHSQDRRAVLEALSPTCSFLSFGNLLLMQNFLRRHWSDLDVQATWWDCFESISDTAFLF